MKRRTGTGIFFLLLVCFLLQTGAADGNTLKDGISPLDAITTAASCAAVEGYELNSASAKTDEKGMSIDVGSFTVSVEVSGGTASGAELSTGYLDADLASAMGRIFGRMLHFLGAFDSPEEILESIDFNSFNHLEANTQTLVFGDYRITARVDPKADKCYQLSMKLRSTGSEQKTARQRTAEEILLEMAPSLSGKMVYTEKNDPNHSLGKEGSYTSKVNFALKSIMPQANASSIEVEQGGSVEVFSAAKDAVDRAQKVVSAKMTYFGTTEYTFVCETALLRLSPDVPAREAGDLVAAFIRTVKQEKDYPAKAEEKRGAGLELGSIVRFGKYEQDNNPSNGAEKIEWKVLKAEEGKALLVSCEALEVYNTYWGSPTWDHSTLRAWLNGAFLEMAFSPEEQSALALSLVPADPNPNYNSDPGTDTQDRVFCLSYKEAAGMLTAEERKTKPARYARENRQVYTEGEFCYWWLRSPGKPGCGAAVVCPDGSFDYDASYDGFCYGVRPAVWVQISQIEQ